MATYILLLTMTSEGRERMLDDPESLLRAQSDVSIPGVQLMGLYGVLGDYDFVSLVDAPDNDAVARFSLELGVKAGAHVTTLPAIPITRFAGPDLASRKRSRLARGRRAEAAPRGEPPEDPPISEAGRSGGSAPR